MVDPHLLRESKGNRIKFCERFGKIWGTEKGEIWGREKEKIGDLKYEVICFSGLKLS